MKSPIFIVSLIIWSNLTYSQEKSPKTIDVNTDVDVIVVYEQVIREGYGTSFIYKELADAYYFKNSFASAKEWYEKLFEAENSLDETSKFRYNQSLKALSLEMPSGQLLTILEKPD